MGNEKKIEIPFGAFDSELIHQEINIPNGFNAVIDGNKIILTRVESEDERIRKTLIRVLNENIGNGIEKYGAKLEDALAWLEKQGEQRPIWHNEDEEPKRGSLILLIMQSGTPIVAKIIEPNHTFNHGERWAYIDDLLEKQAEVESDNDDIEAEEEGIRKAFNKIRDKKQGKQKPSGKVEPKFHEGDWIVFNGLALYVKEVVKGFYRTISKGGIPNSYDGDIDNAARLWTIQDAKDGDVLVCPLQKGYENDEQIFIFKGINSRDYVDNCIEYYCRICNGVFYENKNGYMGTTSSPLQPATKEQRDALMKAITDAGYEWDAEMKELKKVEDEEYNGEDYGIDSLFHAQRILEKTLGRVEGYQTDDGILSHKCAITAVKKLYEQKPAEWSEEDEKIFDRICALIHSAAYKNYDVDEDGNECGEYANIKEWFKKLKDRVQLQNIAITDEELVQAKKDAYNDALDKIEYHSGEPTFDDGWSAAIWYLKKRNAQPQNRWKPSDEQIKICKEVYADILSAKGFDLGTVNSELNRMEEQLKKLREE